MREGSHFLVTVWAVLNLSALDSVVLLAYLAGMVAIGLWFGRDAKTVEDYTVADRDPRWWLILASIIATETSTVTFLSVPGFAYGKDLTWIQLPLGYLVGRVVVAYVLLPHYFRGSLFTAYEVLHRRFGGATRRVGSVLFLATRSLADGLRLLLTALVVQEMTGLSLEWAVVVMGVTTIVYCYFGGMRAVLWTDLAQLVIYLGGALVAFWILLTRLPGGWGQMLEMGSAAGKLRIVDFTFDLTEPFGFWAGLLGGAFLTLGTHGVDQLMVQRYLCSRDERDARKALISSGFFVFAQFALFLLIGVGLWCFYQLHPPGTPFDRTDRVFARFILEELPTGLVGLLLGALFAAAMSTLSSSLNSCATTAMHDLYLPFARTMPPERQLRVTRWLTALFGVVQIGVGIAGQWVNTAVVNSVLGIAGFTTGIVLGVFFLGLFTKRVGQRAALAGMLVGLAGMTSVYFATNLAFPWYALVGSGITFAAGVTASLVWPDPTRRAAAAR